MQYYLTCIAFILCLAITPLIRLLATRKGWVAQPTKERWHKKPTAQLGGVAIYFGIAIPLLFVSDFYSFLPYLLRTSDNLTAPSIGAVIWLGMTLLFILGLLDDFLSIKPQTKLVAQIMIASVVAFLGFRLHWFSSHAFDTIVTIGWIVGIINALNLLDNMDGLCAGIGCITALFLAFLFFGTKADGMTVAMITAGCLAAFLVYNFNPASIFMGDCGSLMIGFILAMLSLYFSETRAANSLSYYAIPVLLLLVPIFDTTMVTIIRLLSGRKASVGGKDHASHRLVLMGFSEKRAVLFLYGITFISGIAALFVNQNDTVTSPAVIIPVFVAILLMGIYLAQLRVYPEKEFSLLRDRSYTPILIELTAKRQIFQVVLDFCLIAFSYYLSYRLRFSSDVFPYYFQIFLRSLPAVIACKFVAFYIMGIYRGIWGSLSSNDTFQFLKAATLATLLSVAAVTFIYRFVDFSKGIFVIDWLLTIAFLLGTRGSFRLFIDTVKRRNLDGSRVLIYGAGRGGEILLREILNNEKHKINPVGFIDDDSAKVGKSLQGFPIYGSLQSIEFIIKKQNINGLLISFNHMDTEHFAEIKRYCRHGNLFLKQFSVSIRDLDLDD